MAKKEEKSEKEKLEDEIKELKSPYAGVEWVTPGVNGYEINYKGVFSQESLVKAIVTQFQERGFKSILNKNLVGDTGNDDYEILYEDRTVNDFRQVQQVFRAKKTADLADLYLHVNLTLLGVSSKEVMHDGQKIKMESAEIIVWLKGGLKPTLPLQTRKKKKDISFLEPVIGKDGNKLFDRFYFREQEAIEEISYEEVIKMMNLIRLILGLPITKNPASFMFQQKGVPMLSTNAPSTDPKVD